jgi:hypothetical protein
MAPFNYYRFVEHPYAKRHEKFAHFCGTNLHHPPYSIAAVTVDAKRRLKDQATALPTINPPAICTTMPMAPVPEPGAH